MLDFWPIIFGHWMADYLLQSKKMAVEKSRNWKICLLHCLIYTTCVAIWYSLVDWRTIPQVAILAFASHFPIDYWSLTEKWLKFIRGRNVMDAFEETRHDPFAAPVYLVVDNGLHLTILYLAMRLLV